MHISQKQTHKLPTEESPKVGSIYKKEAFNLL